MQEFGFRDLGFIASLLSVFICAGSRLQGLHTPPVLLSFIVIQTQGIVA